MHEKKVLEVHVEKGMQNGQKITFPGEVDEAPDTVTGDIVFVLQQKEHPKFKRKGDDIFVEHTLSLTEALCGIWIVDSFSSSLNLRRLLSLGSCFMDSFMELYRNNDFNGEMLREKNLTWVDL